LLCSTNWFQKPPDGWLDPLRIMLNHITSAECELTKLIFIGGDSENDQQWRLLRRRQIAGRNPNRRSSVSWTKPGMVAVITGKHRA
jgi:hypothetical protein